MALNINMQEEKPQIPIDLIQSLTTERDSLDESFENARRLLSEAIEREKGAKKNGLSDDDILNVVPPQPLKLSCRAKIPLKEHPKYNFVGKLLGPKGSTLKQLQLDTGTRLSILGRNSMRDKVKEEEHRQSGDVKYAHLHKDLHILIEAFCPAPEAYSRIGHALTEIKKYLTPEPSEDMRQNHMMELGGMGGGPTLRGAMSRGRGRGNPARGMVRPLGGVAPRGRPLVSRGSARGGLRGRGAPTGRGRPAPRPLAYQPEEEYYDDGYGESYEGGAAEETYAEGAVDDGSYYSEGGAGDGYQSGDYGSSQTGTYGSQASGGAASYGGYASGGTGWSSGGAGRQSMKSATQYTQKPTTRPYPYARY